MFEDFTPTQACKLPEANQLQAIQRIDQYSKELDYFLTQFVQVYTTFLNKIIPFVNENNLLNAQQSKKLNDMLNSVKLVLEYYSKK